MTEDHGWQADLARSVATDAQSGTREVASLGLQQQDLSSLQRSASETLSASESYHRTASAQRRFGVSASYGAAETGLRLASDTNNMGRLDSALDRFGLRGDAQRLGAAWRTTGLIVDKEQAYAAAGMALLTGYSSPIFRKLNEDEARQAETAGYQILGDVWNAPAPDQNLSPRSNAGLAHQGPHFGDAGSAVQATRLHDPRNEVGNLSGQVRSHIQETSNGIFGGDADIDAAYHASQAAVQGETTGGFNTMHADKASFLRAQISHAARAQWSVAEGEYNLVGGTLYNLAQDASGLGAGAKAAFAQAFKAARQLGKGDWDAFREAATAVPDVAEKAIYSWADQRVAETGEALTLQQRQVYRAAIFESFAGFGVGPLSEPLTPALHNAERKLMASEGEISKDIADLLKRAAGQNREDLIGLIGTYNRTKSP